MDEAGISESEFDQAKADERDEDGDDLRNGLMFAHAFRGQDDVFVRGDGAQAGDEKFAGDDDHHHPHRRDVQANQADERAGDEHLVGERIEQLAQVR